MAYKIDKLPGEPIIIDTHMEPVNPAGYPQFAAEMAALTQSIEGTVYRITDLSQMNFSFPLLVQVFAEETRTSRPGSVGDPRVRTVIVAVGETAVLSAATSNHPHYGARGIPIYDNVEAALAHVREQLKNSK
jgi:hypothetical protein